ncbi:MAG: hypothetical protein ACOCTR_04370 [Candidatus Natronoplasma sp.]
MGGDADGDDLIVYGRNVSYSGNGGEDSASRLLLHTARADDSADSCFDLPQERSS